MTNQDLTISVIVPAYNLENHIEKTLDSIINQTYKNLEIIVVDDGSQDKTFDKINSIAKSDSRVIPIHQQNGGVSKARLVGIKKATGDLIAFVDGDDIIESDMYEFLLQNMMDNDADISHCGYKMVFPSGREDLYYGTGKTVIQDNETGVYDLLNASFIEPGLCNKLYKADLFKKLLTENKMDYSIKINEDLLMNYYLFSLSSKSVFVDECKYNYVLRKNSASTSSFNENKFYDPIKVREIILEDSKENKKINGIAFRRYIGVLIGDSTAKIPKKYRKTAKEKLKQNKERVFKTNCLSKKLKLMTFGVLYLYPVYFLVRRVYEKVTKIDKKYDVN